MWYFPRLILAALVLSQKLCWAAQRALRASADTALKRMERCRKVFVGIYGAEFLEMTTLHEDYTWKVIKVEKANGLAQRGCGCTVKLDGQTLLASFSLRSEARPQSRR